MISLNEIDKAYSDYSLELFSYIMRSVHDHDTAEDILQDVFIKLINYSLKSNVNSINIRALLYSIARSVCIDYARKTPRLKFEITDISAIPDVHTSKNDDQSAVMMDEINTLIETLHEPEKSIILFRRNGLIYSEIAQIMKISERTLKRKVKNVISDMRKNLRNQGFFISDDTEINDDPLNK
jgi:RNA polymerase sigma-70 factor, ECF subfamily